MMMMSGSEHHETAAGGSTSSEGERSFYHLDLTDSEDDYQPPSSSSDSESHESESETFCSPSSISRRPKKRKSTPVKSVRVTQASSSSTPVNRPLQEQSRPTQRHSRILPMMTVDQLATETPRRSRSPMDQQNIIQVLHRIEQKIDDMGKDIKKLKEDQAELEKQITTTKSRGSNADNKIYVPPKIRTAVHDGYKAVISDGAKEWITSEENRKFKFLSEENVETSKLVETYVKGLYPDVQPGVIQAATARYFESVQQKQHKEKTGKKEAHNNKMLLYSRKKRKLSWRSSMIMRKTGWDEEKKKKIDSAMDIAYMSSEEEVNSEDETFLRVKPLPWRSSEYKKVLDELDRKFERSQSSRSKRQMMKRVLGEIPSLRPKPSHIKPGNEWVFA